MTAHAKLSPSASKRWLMCPGSMVLNEDLPNPPSDYTNIGTIAHAVCECSLKRGDTPERYLGWWGFVNDLGGAGLVKELGQNADNVFTYKVDREMVEAVTVYVDTIRADIACMYEPDIKVEQCVNVEWLAPGIFGTADCIVVEPLGLMRVYDYKNGRTVVEVENNSQAMIYGLGAIGEGNPLGVEEIELVIIQPNASHSDGPIRRWRLTPEELLSWGVDTLAPGAQAVELGDTRLCAGDWCQFCPAKRQGVCPEIRRQMFDALDVETDSAAMPVQANPTLPDPAMLSPAQVARILRIESLFTSFIKDVKTKALEDAKAGRGLPPGFKMVAGRASRKWGDETQVKARLSRHKQDVYDIKLKSVAQMEKMIKANGGDPGVELEGLIEVNRGVMLAPEEDKRKAIEPMFT